MKILYAYRYGIVGGVSTQLLLRQVALNNSGIDCHLYFSQNNGLYQVLPQQMHAQVFFGGMKSYDALVNDGQYDAIIVIDSPELLKGSKKQLFLDIHTTTERGLSYLQNIDTDDYSGMMVPSNYSATLVGQILSNSKKLIHVVPNTLNTSVFNLDIPIEIDTTSVPYREYIWVGKLDQHKNWRLALVYARIIKDLIGSFRFYVVGGFAASKEIGSAFFQLIHELEISDCVIWLDRLANHQLANLYKRCAVTGGAMLITSRDESFGMAAAESLLCGCPLIANDLPAFKEVFPDSTLIKCIDIYQPEEFISAFESLDTTISSDERRKISSILTEKYGPEAFVKELIKVIK